MTVVRIDFNVNDSRRSLGALLRVLSSVNAEQEHIALDLAACKYMGPMAVAALAAAHQQWVAAGIAVEATAPRHDQLRAYCRYAGLAALLGFGGHPDPTHKDNMTTPPRLFRQRDNQAILEVGQLVARFVSMTRGTEDVLQVLIAELVQNAVDHAGSPGCISARVFKKKRDVRVAVVDRGDGLRATLARVHHVGGDQDAVRLALERGRSSHSSAHNLGQGLNLLDDLISNNGGDLTIASGHACYSRRARQSAIHRLSVPCPGTLCLMRFRIDDDLYASSPSDDGLW